MWVFADALNCKNDTVALHGALTCNGRQQFNAHFRAGKAQCGLATVLHAPDSAL